VSEALVAAQLEAYNRQDLDAHCACFADDVIVADVGGDVRVQGIHAYRALYAKLFADFPHNHAELVRRTQIGTKVIDHERVRRAPDAEPFEVLAIYTLRDDRIARVDFVRD
jgi:hypothetical protein